MSYDLYQQETEDKLNGLQPVQDLPPGAFDNFASGVGLTTMKGLAETARAVDMARAAVPVLIDKLRGGTELQDQYFKKHEDVFQRAVDYWTPKPSEVGTAAQVVGDLISTLPVAMFAPELAIAKAQMGSAEDLTRAGVDTTKAQAVGGLQGATMGLGIWMPILGKNLWQRVVLGGAGYNAVQGVATRAVAGKILEGTPQAEQFKAFDGEAMTLDVLLGMAFGGWAHLNPEARAHGEEVWNRLGAWAEKLNPSQKAAIATLREAQHMNVDSTPGKPVEAADIQAHVDRMKTSIDQMATDKPVHVEDLPEPRMEPDPVREQENVERTQQMLDIADQVREQEGLPKEELNVAGRTVTEQLQAPPPVGEAPADVSETDRQLVTGHPDPLNLDITHPDMQSALRIMASEAGWAEVGGRHGEGMGEGERTVWVPIADWYEGGMGDRAYITNMVEKAIAGKKLGEQQKLLLAHMMKIVNERLGAQAAMGPDEFAHTVEALREESVPATTENVFDTQAIARAMEINSQATDEAMARYDVHDDDAIFMAEIRSIIDENIQANPQPDQGGPKAADTAAKPADGGTDDPVRSEAARIVALDPDRPITIGTDANGERVTSTLKEYLDAANEEARQAREDANLFKVAAECLMGTA